MKKTIQIIAFLWLSNFISLKAISQEIKRCAAHDVDSVLSLKSSKRIANKIEFEKQIQNYLANNLRNARVSAEVIRIPVVVHVIHNNSQGTIGGATNTNISNEQIFSQIKVLNEDYRKKINTLGYNTNPVGADMEIEFFLASRDPDGNATTGITRTYTSRNSFNVFNDEATISALSYWDSNRYLNIWVCALQSGYLGFTEFPGASSIDGLDASDVDERIDGTYIDYRAFGKKTGTSTSGLYSFGRTASHEIGHFFGLIHPWGDVLCYSDPSCVCGTDYCNDTPPTSAPNGGKYCVDIFSYCGGIKSRNMIENYMDYSPDSCMNIFTQDQKSRTRAVMDLSKRRRRLINYAKSLDLPVSSTLSVTVLPNPAFSNIYVQVLFPDFQNFTVDIYNINGVKVFTQIFTDLPSTVVNLTPTDLSSGEYILSVSTAKEKQIKRIFYTK